MLYYNILKIDSKATSYLKQSFNLAQSLSPVPVNVDWYKVSLMPLAPAHLIKCCQRRQLAHSFIASMRTCHDLSQQRLGS